MRRYMHEYGVGNEAFAGFTINAHRNAADNPNAMFRSPITAEQLTPGAGMIADPINLLDSSPIVRWRGGRRAVPRPTRSPASPRESAVASAPRPSPPTAVAVHDRRDPLWFWTRPAISARRPTRRPASARRTSTCSSCTTPSRIMSALSLEAAGFAPRGKGVRLALDGEIALDGRIPITTMGGLKARGHPVGATGVYQIVEVVQQLRGEAGANQVPDARIGMAQNIGGSGATVITHILGAVRAGSGIGVRVQGGGSGRCERSDGADGARADSLNLSKPINRQPERAF